jgi:hypothetical protein
MANGDVDVTEGSGKKVATYEISEDAVTREIQRVALNNVAGVEAIKLIDTATGGTDPGILALATRDDALTTLTPADGDNVQLRVNSEGALWVSDPDAPAVSQTTKGGSIPVTMASDQETIGGIARAHGTNPGAVTAGNAVFTAHNRHGVLFTIGGHPNSICRAFEIADGDGAQTDLAIVGSISAGTKVVVTALGVRADQANSGNVEVRVGFGAANVPAASVSGANGILLHVDLAAGDGNQLGNGTAIVGVGADGEELRLTCEDPVGGSLYVWFTYYTIES